ncbi:hypothetical protein NHX12_023079 [Muraenolepis orangiensis]|uniref:UPAR/Ly6 domain-containing protein n=2 Tax=Muraenolepis orangiensis TaxID=630683 RepID=A0A9Q0ISE9_9TELE|nr:hypothetical protein NHX12_023079 [Muraenolepis orangiensis]
MNILLVASVLLAVPAVMGQLMCNTCPVNLEEDCLGNSATTVTCGTNERCFIGSASQLMCNTCPLNLEEDCLGDSPETATCGTNETCFIRSSTCGLSCRRCTIGVFGRCLLPSQITCADSTPNCYFGNARFNATGILRLHNRGCLATALCNQTQVGSILGAGYSSSYSCCTTDLCNGATPTQLSLTALCCAAVLASLWAA